MEPDCPRCATVSAAALGVCTWCGQTIAEAEHRGGPPARRLSPSIGWLRGPLLLLLTIAEGLAALLGYGIGQVAGG